MRKRTSKFIYVGPTIVGVATRNTVYDGMPDALKSVIQTHPFMSGLCIPLSGLASAMSQIQRGQGGIYTLYLKALAESETIQKGAN